ncbi:MAG: hypothetical protein ACE141_16120 [Bryobacteraceae bacterium]
MKQRTFLLIAGVVFLLIAIGHLARVVLGATFVVEGVSIPMWPSVVVVVAMGYLALEAFRLRGKSKPAS